MSKDKYDRLKVASKVEKRLDELAKKSIIRMARWEAKRQRSNTDVKGSLPSMKGVVTVKKKKAQLQ